MVRELAMFPLGSVVVPGDVVPLHVFEPRYRELVRACLAAEVPELGVVLIERGSEVGGGDSRFGTGCLARIAEAAALSDGRYAIVVVGVCRIQVQSWLPDDPYPRAVVTDWPDPEPEPGSAAGAAALVPGVERALALAAELGEASAPGHIRLPADPVAASYALTSLAPLGPLDRLTLLASPSPEARLAALAAMVEDATTVLASRLGGI